MADPALERLAERAGVDAAYVARLYDLGILARRADDQVHEGDVRRIGVVRGLESGGIPTELIGEALRRGALSLEFVDQPSYDRFAGTAAVTFRELSRQHAIPLELLLVVREAMGFPAPDPDDSMRETELRVVPFLELLTRVGIRPELVEQNLRVAADGMRRAAEMEASWWRSEILQPLFEAGVPPDEIGRRTEAFARESGPVTDEAMLAIYHGQQRHAWMRNIFEGFEALLAQAGMLDRLERVPAICFFDVAGYTRLTEERGDAHAAGVAGQVARVVQRVATAQGGKAIKWLGDGIMFHFAEPAPAVLAALDMMDAVATEGLPPGHAGIHAGPVLFQEGDYFGRTVNGAARIAERATAGQVLVSAAVVGASTAPGVTFEPIGPVELKGLVEPLVLFLARRASSPG